MVPNLGRAGKTDEEKHGNYGWETVEKGLVCPGEGQSQKEIRRNFFMVRVVDRWNELPEEIKGAKSLNSFKNQLDRWTEKSRVEADSAGRSQLESISNQ